METITVNGKDYSLVGNNEIDLKEAFHHSAVTSGYIPGATIEIFNTNVAAYHENEKYASLVDGIMVEDGNQNPTLMLYAFSGPQAHKEVAKQARAAGLSSAVSRKTSWDRALVKEMFPVAFNAMSEYFQTNKDAVRKAVRDASDEDITSFGETLGEVLQIAGKYQISGPTGIKLSRTIGDNTYERQVSMAIKCEVWDTKRLVKEDDTAGEE